MKYIDMHCDTLVECYRTGASLRKNDLSIDLEKLKHGNALAQFFAIFIPEEETAAKGVSPYDFFSGVHAFYQREMEANQALIRPAGTYAQLIQNMENSLPSSILTVEDAALLDNRIERVADLYAKGVRLITLTWNHENCIGFPNSADAADHQRGLKPFGFDVVEEMNRLGMLIDVSHLSAGGFDDVLRYSKKPVVASHSCARALCDHPRNLTDLQLKALAAQGGMVGVNFCSAFLRKGSCISTVSDITAHIRHMVDVMGIDHVGLGSDFDGIDCQLEIRDYNQFGLLLHELKQYFSTDEIEKICYKNCLRILQTC